MADSDSIIEKPEGANATESVNQGGEDPFVKQGLTSEDIDQKIETITSTASGFSAGMMLPWAGLLAKIPEGWLLCDGSTVSRSQYSDLFTAIGTQWGAGDGSTTFAVPNLTQRFLQGIDTATTEPGTTGGATNKTTSAAPNNSDAAGGVDRNYAQPSHTHTISDIRPKYAEAAWIIKT